MQNILRSYDRLIYGLACLAGISLAIVTVLVIYDVISRNLGLRPFRAISAIVEYVLLFSTMAAAPWLVRINGHVSVSSILALLPRAVQGLVNRLSLILGAGATGLLGVVAARLAIAQARAGNVDVRAVSLPAWILYAFLSVGFFLMATELLRMLMRGETYTGAEGDH
jgi:C4-dicarboxylate transporter, DctQ subunit